MSIKDDIQNLINKNDICLFMKGTPDAPQCGFSMTVANVLKHLDTACQAKGLVLSSLTYDEQGTLIRQTWKSLYPEAHQTCPEFIVRMCTRIIGE